MSLTAIIGPVLFNSLFATFTDEKGAIYFPGAAFIVAALFLLLGLFFAFLSLRHYQQPSKTDQPQ
jgi:DHA1 family tetracycline resistance protein-like MFS transporter